jgi:membrane-bound metal-dependent hydrolase YbcI (DUF457 family)
MRRLEPAWSARLSAEADLLPALLGGLVGGVSHVVLDAIMHWDMHPLRPWSQANPLLSAPFPIHLACVAMGVIGVALYATRRSR